MYKRQRLSQATVNAVDAIGERTAKELEASAEELERQAHDTAAYLRQLATGMRKFSQEAARQVSDFCLKNQEVLSTMQGLEQKDVYKRQGHISQLQSGHSKNVARRLDHRRRHPLAAE